jgi:hypothetical protein
VAGRFLIPTAVQNIIDHASGKRPVHSIPNSIPFFSLISLGPTHAIQCLNGIASIDPKAGAMKFDMARDYP